MTTYQGKIEAKEPKVAKNMQQYFVFTIDKKKWNCFSPEVNQEFNVGDYVTFETEKKGEYENLIPETMKKVVSQLAKYPDAPEPAKGNPQGESSPTYSGEHIKDMLLLADKFKDLKKGSFEGFHKNINENPDSLEIGTPSKGGAIKIYGDFSNPQVFIDKFTNAKKVRDEANRLLSSDVI